MKFSKILNTKFWAGLLLAQLFLFFIISKINFIVSLEAIFFEFQKPLHQSIFSWVSFSVGDLLYIFLGILFIYFSIKIGIKKSRKNYSIKLLKFFNLTYFIYQIFWGMLYFQEPLIKKLPREEPSLEEAQRLAWKYLEICKKDREMVREDKNGVFKIYDTESLKIEILKKQSQILEFSGNRKPTFIKNFKPSLFNEIMSFTGIFGYYNPFTAEAQYNPNLPSSTLPFTLAHESAHQLGYAREQEASFMAYLIGKNSNNIELKYSIDLFVLKSLLNSLEEKNTNFAKQVIEKYSDGMKRDRLFEKSFSKKHEGMLSRFFDITNHLFLKTNQQEGNITYSYFIDLLIRFERRS